MSLSVRTRFEVLKRDKYTCSYCGKHPPEVLLEVDHIHPIAAGGTDDMANLTTACTDCNRGKGARMLEEGTAPAINRSAMAEMAERVEQAKAYMELLGALQQIKDDQVWRVTEAWAKAYGATLTEVEDGGVVYRLPEFGRWPEDRSVKKFITKLGLEPVLDAIDITAARIKLPNSDAVRYFYGVCHHSIREGREPLSQQQDPISAEDLIAYSEDGQRRGAEAERERIGLILRNHQEYGFATLEDAIAAIWPTDE